MNEIAELLDKLTPSYDDRAGDWERVAAKIRRGRRARTAVAAVLAGAAVAVLALAWPFHSEQGGLVERALAAAGDGPVLHVVLRGEWGGTLVKLESGKRTPVYGDDEYWYDTQSGRIHSIGLLGGTVQSEELDRPKDPPVELKALGRDYRRALEQGAARVAEHGTVDGQPVAWFTIKSLDLPDVADGKNHLFEQQVAVSERTYKPVAFRAKRDGKQSPGTFEHVLELEFSAAGSGDFTASPALSFNGALVMQGRTPLPLGEAATLLGRAPVWLGRDYHGLPLAAAFRQSNRIGHRHDVELRGSTAAAAKRCVARRSRAGACFRALGIAPIEVRGGRVFTSDGPTVWTQQETDLVLFYGTMGDDPTTFREDSVPHLDRPYVMVSETTHATRLRLGAGSYVPPAGAVFLTPGQGGFLQADGLQVGLQAADEDVILAAARALKPMSP